MIGQIDMRWAWAGLWSDSAVADPDVLPPRFRPQPPGCPRCRGRLFHEWDPDTGHEWACLNCGWRRCRQPRQQVPLSG